MAELDDYQAITVKALADRLAEAFAEWLHLQVRREWYAPDEQLPATELVAERFRGIRPAFGYPACPDHSEKGKLFALLDAEAYGMSLTESYAMLPAAAVSGVYFAHPESRYFSVGRIGRDQLADYAGRKGEPVADRRALARADPHLTRPPGRLSSCPQAPFTGASTVFYADDTEERRRAHGAHERQRPRDLPADRGHGCHALRAAAEAQQDLGTACSDPGGARSARRARPGQAWPAARISGRIGRSSEIQAHSKPVVKAEKALDVPLPTSPRSRW